jgi:hypothetical protein
MKRGGLKGINRSSQTKFRFLMKNVTGFMKRLPSMLRRVNSISPHQKNNQNYQMKICASAAVEKEEESHYHFAKMKRNSFSLALASFCSFSILKESFS